MSVTFLVINDEVAFLVACCYGICYTIPIRVLGQNGGDECVGAGVFGNKRSISAQRSSSLTSAESENTHMETHSKEIQIIYTGQSISSLIRLMVEALACHFDSTFPLSRPEHRQMIISTVTLKSLN